MLSKKNDLTIKQHEQDFFHFDSRLYPRIGVIVPKNSVCVIDIIHKLALNEATLI